MSHAHDCRSPFCTDHNGLKEHVPGPGLKHRTGGAVGRCCDSDHCADSKAAGGSRSHRVSCEPSVNSLAQDLASLTAGKPGGSACENGHCHCDQVDSAISVLPSRVLPPKEESSKIVPEFEPITLGLPDEYGIVFEVYRSEEQMADIMRLISRDLSEPYSIYTYRYFIHNWPHLCFLAVHEGQYVGAIVCKLDLHKRLIKRGYIAMLAVDEKQRRKKIGSKLVRVAVDAMIAQECEEVVLETEVTNKAALRLYENLGFVRDKRLLKYYLNGVDAFRLKLWLR